MEWLQHLLWRNGTFLGLKSYWEILGWVGMATFSTRFFVQWYATERKRQVVVPVAFWWLSLIGSLLMLAYALLTHRGWVVVCSYAFTWIPYLRNLVIHVRHKSATLSCPACEQPSSPGANFCAHCGAPLLPAKVAD